MTSPYIPKFKHDYIPEHDAHTHTVGVKKKVPIYRPYNGTGNSVPFPFRSRLISVRLPFLSVFKPFPFCSTGSPSVLVNSVIKHAQSLIAVTCISAGRLATFQ